MLPDLDSNQDIQIQKLTYYPYTIGQEAAKIAIKCSQKNKYGKICFCCTACFGLRGYVLRLSNMFCNNLEQVFNVKRLGKGIVGAAFDGDFSDVDVG